RAAEAPTSGMGGAAPAAGFALDSGITTTEIHIGNSSAYSGPNARYRRGAAGYEAYFAYLNAEQGGIDGRRIRFTSYDDGYAPAATLSNVRRWVEEDGVFLTVGVFGTPGTAAVLPYLSERGVPLLFPVTAYS